MGYTGRKTCSHCCQVHWWMKMTRKVADENIAALEMARSYIRKRFLAGQMGEDSVTMFVAGKAHVFPTMDGIEYVRQDKLLLAEMDCLNLACRMVAASISAEENQKGRGWSSGQATFGMGERVQDTKQGLDVTPQLTRRALGSQMVPATKQELVKAIAANKTIHLVKE